MSEAHEHLGHVRLRLFAIEVGVRVLELGVLLSAFDSMAQEARLLILEEGNVPPEELPGITDPAELLAGEEDMTTAEAVQTLRGFLDMSAEGEARLWRLLQLVDK